MPPLHLLVHAADARSADRIVRAIRNGDPACETRLVADPAELQALLAQSGNNHVVATTPDAPPSGIAPALRHELNNHLALIRMLAEVLTEAPELPAAHRAKAAEICASAEAAAQTIRRSKTGD